MTALVSRVIVDHIEFLANEAEYWAAKAAYWKALGNEKHETWCMDLVNKAEQRAMVWAERLETVQ
jgi:hypothetical protein